MTKGFSRKELAAFVRADIKACQKKGQLPKDMKVSVRIQSYSGGGSINVRVTEAGFKVCEDSYLHNAAGGHYRNENAGYLTVQAEAVKNKLSAILAAYNYDDSEIQTDYFDVRFYGHAEYDYNLVGAEVDAYKANMKCGEAPHFNFLAHREAVEAASVLPENYGDMKGLKAAVAARALGADKPAPKPISQAVADVVATIERRQPKLNGQAVESVEVMVSNNPKAIAEFGDGSGKPIAIVATRYAPAVPEISEYEQCLKAAGLI
jgi:hypothetical protein